MARGNAWLTVAAACSVFMVWVIFRVGAESAATETATTFPEPDAVYNTDARTCMVYLVEGSSLQYWQCSDGCEYIGTWKVKAPQLICPNGEKQ